MKGSPLEAMLATGGRDHPDALLQEASALERKLLALLEVDGTDDEEYNNLRRKVRKHYAQLILWHHEFAQTHDIETALWKNVYYKHLEILRRRLRTSQLALNNDKRQDELAKQLKKDAVAFLNLLDSANYFYKELMKQLQKQHGSVGAIGHPTAKPMPLDPTPAQYLLQRSSKPVVDIHGTCGRILTILGDLTRYRGEASHKLAADVNSAPPEWFYEQAARVWPEGGQPLNQLAVMALHKRKHLQSAYYYARALSSAQYFPQAHGNLVQLWERNQRAYNQLANDAGEPIGHNRHLSMAMEGLALRFEKVLMMVYEGQGGDDFNAGVEDVVADLVSVIRAPEFFNEWKHCSPSCNQMLHITMLAIFGVYSTSSSFPGNLPGLSVSRAQGQVSKKNAYALFLQVASILVSAVGHSSYGQDVSPLLSGPVFVILSWMAKHVVEITSESDDTLDAGFWSAAADMAALLRSRGAAPPPLTENQKPIPEEVELRGFLPLDGCFKEVDFQQQPWEGELLDAACRSKLWSKCCNLAQMLRELVHDPKRDHQVLLAMKRFIAAVLPCPSCSGSHHGPEHLELSDLSSVVPITPMFGHRSNQPLAAVAEALTETSASQSLKMDTGSTAYHSVTNDPAPAMGSGLVMEDEDIEGEIVMFQASLDQAGSDSEHTSQSVQLNNPKLATPPVTGPLQPLMPEGSALLEKAKRGNGLDSVVEVERMGRNGGDYLVGGPDVQGGEANSEGELGQGHRYNVLEGGMDFLGKGGDGNPHVGAFGKGLQAVDGETAGSLSPVRQGSSEPDNMQRACWFGLSPGCAHQPGKAGVKKSRFYLAPPPFQDSFKDKVSKPEQQDVRKGTDQSAPATTALSKQERTLSLPSIDVADTAVDVLNDVFPISHEDLISQLRRLGSGKPPAPEGDMQPAEPHTVPTQHDDVDLQSIQRAGHADSGTPARVQDSSGASPPGSQHHDLAPGSDALQSGGDPLGLLGSTKGPVAESCTGRDDLIGHLSKLYMNLGGTAAPGGFEPTVSPTNILGHEHLQPVPPGFGVNHPALAQSPTLMQPGTERHKPVLQVPLPTQNRQQDLASLGSITGYGQAHMLHAEAAIPPGGLFGVQTGLSSLSHSLPVSPLGLDQHTSSAIAPNLLPAAHQQGAFLGLGLSLATPGAALPASLPLVYGSTGGSAAIPPPGIKQGSIYCGSVHPGLVRPSAAGVLPSEGITSLVAQQMGMEPMQSAAAQGAVPVDGGHSVAGEGLSDPAVLVAAPFPGIGKSVEVTRPRSDR